MDIGRYGRGLASAVLYRLDRLWLRVQIGLQSVLGIAGHYQPNPFVADSDPRDRRAVGTLRIVFESVAGGALNLHRYRLQHRLFYVRMAQRGGVASASILVATKLVTRAGLRRCTASATRRSSIRISANSIAALPQTDVIICMSVFHHWCARLGSRRPRIVIYGKALQLLVFETGQHDEIDTSWARHLSFMGKDCDSWIRDFLMARGFQSVELMGDFSTTLSAVPRHLYVAKMPPRP